MTVPLALIILALAVVLTGVLVALTIRSSFNHFIHTFNEKPVSVESPEVARATHRIAIAAERAADDRPAQQKAREHADMSENLVLGISNVLDKELTHPEGLKDDVITGRTQADQELKDRLRTELNKALNTLK